MSKYNIQKFTVPGTIIDISEDTQVVETDEFYLNGLLRGILVTAPITTSETFAITIQADSEFVTFNNDGLQPGTTAIMTDENQMQLAVPLSGMHNLKITAAAEEAADRVFIIQLLIDRS